MMLESRPPDRKLDTGTSATRCAADALLDHGLQVSGRAWRGLPRPRPARASSVLLMRAVGAEARPAACRELADALDGAPLLRHPVIEHGRHHRARLDLQFRADAASSALSSEANTMPCRLRRYSSGLMPSGSRASDELSGRRVRDREREHAAEPRQRLRSPVPPGLEHDLGVGAR